MTAPREKADKAATASASTRADRTDGSNKRTTQATDPAEAARSELHGVGFTGLTMPAVLGDDVFERWAAEVKSNPAYQLRDPNDPDSQGATGSAGSTPPPALIVEYGDGPHQYISTVFDAGQAIVQDGSDPSGKAWKFPESAWRRFVVKVRGEEMPDSLKDPNDLASADGPTMHEAAAEQNARTAQSVQADREATTENRANERNR